MQVKLSPLSNSAKNKAWLFIPRPNPAARIRLFCFPYAGGNANAFRSWADKLNPQIEIVALQYPGRATRFKEPLIDSMDQMLASLEHALLDSLHEKPFAFLGHSMGASIAFEFTRVLQSKAYPLPKQLIVSGRRAPCEPLAHQSHPQKQPTYTLPKADFLEKIRQLNGTPAELLEHDDLMELMEPILRNDFKLVETLNYKQEAMLNMPVYVMSGEDDNHVNEATIEAWQDETTESCHFYSFPGDHFFLHTHEGDVLKVIEDILLPV